VVLLSFIEECAKLQLL